MLNAVKILELAKNEFNEKNGLGMAEIIILCEKEIREQAALLKGGNTQLQRYKTALKMLKSKEITRPALKGAWTIEDKQYLCNGFIGFMLDNHIENLPIVEVEKFNLKQVFPTDMANYKTFEIPALSKLKSDVSIALAEYKAINKKELKDKVPTSKRTKKTDMEGIVLIYECDGLKWGCDKELLITALEILGGKEITIKVDIGTLKPALLESENGQAVILPIRLKD